MQSIRELTEKNEHIVLSPYAAFADESVGRERDEEQCDIRTCFQRDRDRIIHSNAFRRLKHKSQVFLSPEGDHYRTRLTHTLEVSQIARTIAVGLRLNEDLTEAISLGHDLGHTPFGHAGERALNSVHPGGYRHYEQSVRVCEKLEKNGMGLNLSYEVINGIERHTNGEKAKTLEGRIVRLADRIAYINHDIDDSIRAGVMTEEDIDLSVRKVLGFSKSERINTLVLSAIENSEDDINLASEVAEAMEELHTFMFAKVYTNPYCKGEEGKADTMLKQLYHYFADNPVDLPNAYEEICLREGADRAACDYISGMTDRFAVRKFEELFIPLSWS
ncbi:MAG: deoxyguanosinetriphosphate triphosphohydrolase [Clostridia bacterium]|nr:deoxyguanosinetriphosphate triphosphohydrolase [Clostridia bacterium]